MTVREPLLSVVEVEHERRSMTEAELPNLVPLIAQVPEPDVPRLVKTVKTSSR